MSDEELETRPLALNAGETPSEGRVVAQGRRHGISAAAVGNHPRAAKSPSGSVDGIFEGVDGEEGLSPAVASSPHGSSPMGFGPPRRGAAVSTAASAVSALFEGLEKSSRPFPVLEETEVQPPEASSTILELNIDSERADCDARHQELDGNQCRQSHDHVVRLQSPLDDKPVGSPSSGKTSQCIAARVAAAVKAAEPQGGDVSLPKHVLQPAGADSSAAGGLAQGMDVGDLLQELSDLAPAAVDHDTVQVLAPSEPQAADSPTPYQTPQVTPSHSVVLEGTSGKDAADPQVAQVADAQLCMELESIQQKLSTESSEKDVADSAVQQVRAELQEERERQHEIAKALRSEARAHEECCEELEERSAEIRHLHMEVARCMARSESQAEQEMRELRTSAAIVDGQAGLLLKDGSPPQNFEAVEARVVEAAQDSAHAREQLEIALKELRAPSPPLLMLTASGEQPKNAELRYFKACPRNVADLQLSLVRSESAAAGSSDRLVMHASNLVWLRDPTENKPELEQERVDSHGSKQPEPKQYVPPCGSQDMKTRPIKLILFTWNMGERQPHEDELEHWLPEEGGNFDMVVVGLQESTYKVDQSPELCGRRPRVFPGGSTSSNSLHSRVSVTITQASERENPFPQSLGPYGVVACETLPRIDDKQRRYEMPQQGLVTRLADARVNCGGTLSPPSRCDAGFRGAAPSSPHAARTVCWAYPTEAGTEEFSRGLSHSARAEIQADPCCALLLFGGFVYFNESGACIAAEAVGPGSELNFDGPFSLERALGQDCHDFLGTLRIQKRLHPITVRDYWNAGAREFAWLGVGEEMGNGKVCASGGFVFFFDRESEHTNCFFILAKPKLMKNRSAVPSTPMPSDRDLGHAITWALHDVEDDSSEEEPEAVAHNFLELVAFRLGSEWRLVRESHLMQMRLAVFARSHLPVTQIEYTWCATGLGNVVGNKGALVIGLEVRGTSLCFISAHLAAHHQFCERRNEDCRHILRQARVRHKSLEATAQYDHCFWFGDLNYRLDVPGSDCKDVSEANEFVHRLLRDRRYEDLLRYDQLRRAHSKHHIFFGYEEGEHDFPPTFKVKRQGGEEYIKQRVPAYCDRVLWKSLPHCQGAVRQNYLSSVPAASTSDHKPLCSHFEITPSDSPDPSALLKDDGLDDASPIYILRLEAEELSTTDGRTKVHPLVAFHSVPACVLNPTPLGARQTKVKSRTLHPQWGHTEVPVLRPAVRREALIEVLSRTTLVLDVLDHEQFSSDEALGTAHVSLVTFESNGAKTVSDLDVAGAFEPPSKRVIEFWAPLVCGNRPCGKVHGKLALFLGEDAGWRADAGIDLKKSKKAGLVKRCCSVM